MVRPQEHQRLLGGKLPQVRCRMVADAIRGGEEMSGGSIDYVFFEDSGSGEAQNERSGR